MGDKEEVVVLKNQRCKVLHDEIAKIAARHTQIAATWFNLNAFSEADCFRKFRFRPVRIVTLSGFVKLDGMYTARNGYQCDPATACCIVPRRLSAPSRWYDLELEFGRS